MKNAVSNKIRLLKNIKPNPDWLQSQRSILFLQIKESGKPAKSVWHLPVFVLPKFSLKTAMVYLLILYLVFGSGFSILQASSNSLPGDLLYPVKIVLENVRMKISSQETQPKLQAEFVGARVDELTKIIDNTADPVKKAEQVVKAVDKLQAQIVSTKVSLDKIKEAQPEKAAEVVQKITEKTIEAKEKIAEEFKEEKPEEVAKVIDAMEKALAIIIGEDKSGIEVQAEKGELDKPFEVDNESIITFPSIPLPMNEASESSEDTFK
jgi:hypothetical protein